jgi:glutamate synthase (NADPH/NADH) small chain
MSQERTRAVSPAKRVRTFEEVYLGLTRNEAIENARIYLERENSVKGQGCPLGTDFFAVLRPLAKGDAASALEKLLETNPLPGVTGRLAPEVYVETQAYNKKGERISLRSIERFLSDSARVRKTAERPLKSKQKIVIVGSGPTGMSAAFRIIRRGYHVVVLESSHVLGGSLSYLYPEFRLPSKVVEEALNYLSESGVEFTTNAILGRDVVLEEMLDKDCSAVLLCCGAGVPRSLGIPGEESAGVVAVEDFFKMRHWMKAGIAPYSTPLVVGPKVVIVGGGERVFDAARILVRLNRAVTIVIEGSESHLGVDAEMARVASEEGVTVRTFARPKSVQADQSGCVKGLVCHQLDYRIDSEGNLRIVEEPDAEFMLPADTVMTASGEGAGSFFLKETGGLQFSPEGTLATVRGSAMTTCRKVFAAGRVVNTNLSLLERIQAGLNAAGEVENFLTT